MAKLADIAPELLTEVQRVLQSEGLQPLAEEIAQVDVSGCTYDESADAGYISFVRPADPGYSGHLAAPVAKTWPFAAPHWFNIDVDHDGHPFGIEVLGRADVIDRLRESGAL